MTVIQRYNSDVKILAKEAFQYSEINLYENIQKINKIPVGFIKK